MKKKGFTLAEVLTTLGIIGVVAAITIPLLNSSTIGVTTGTKLAKFVAQIEQANMMVVQDAGTGSLTEAFTTNNGFFDYVAYKSALARHLKFSDVAYFMNNKSLPIFGIQPVYGQKPYENQPIETRYNNKDWHSDDSKSCHVISYCAGTCKYQCTRVLYKLDGTSETVDAGTQTGECPRCRYSMWYSCEGKQCYRKYAKIPDICLGADRPNDEKVDNSYCTDNCQSGNNEDNNGSRIATGQVSYLSMKNVVDLQIIIENDNRQNNEGQSVEDAEFNVQAIQKIDNAVIEDEGELLLNDSNHSFITKGGITYALYVTDSSGIATSLPPKSQRLGYVIIDIDGVDKGANKYAVDRFGFALFNDGSLRPIGANGWDGSANTTIAWQTSCPNGSIPENSQDRLTCTGSIYANKLKVEYRQR